MLASALVLLTGFARGVVRRLSFSKKLWVPDGANGPEKEALLTDVYSGIHAQVCFLDTRGEILHTNQQWKEFARGLHNSQPARVGGSFYTLCRSVALHNPITTNNLVQSLCEIAEKKRSHLEGCYSVLHEGELRQFELRAYACDSGEQRSIVVLQRLLDDQGIAQQLRLAKRQAETMASALEASQRSLELAVRGGNLGLWHWDVATGYFELNRDWYVSIGQDNIGLDADIVSFRELLHPEDQVLWTPIDAASLCEEEPYDRQFRLRTSNGEYVWVQALGSTNTVLEDGSPESISGILIDINDRKRSELRDTGMAKVIEESLNEVYLIDCESLRFLEVNRGARENLGYSIEELRQMTPCNIVPNYNHAQMRELIAPLMSKQANQVEVHEHHQRRDGSSYPVLVTLQTTTLLDRDIVVAFCADLTQRQELEQQLAHAQKLESIGQLAAGVAHEMNTPLQYISNNTQFLEQCSEHLFETLDACEAAVQECQEGKDSPLAPVAELIQSPSYHRIRKEMPGAVSDSMQGIRRVLEIIRAMKEFSHPGEKTKSLVDLNHLLQSTVTVTKNRWKEHAQLILDYQSDLPAIECDSGSMNQVFVNLLVNASDAIEQSLSDHPQEEWGTITVRTRCLDEELVVEIEDDGCGMDSEVASRAFDPFYTTKEVGQGTGQGLTLCHTIVTQKHAGHITIESEPGQGTLVRVVLPRGGEAPSSEPEVCSVDSPCLHD